jgi:hypothetical protein
MIDIECLGIAPEALILTIAAVAFDPFSHRIDHEHSLYFRVDPSSQPNRQIDESTVAWWAQLHRLPWTTPPAKGCAWRQLLQWVQA